MADDDAHRPGQRSGNASEGDLSERLRNLDAALARARKGQGAGTKSQARSGLSGPGLVQALRLTSEFVAGIAVGAGVGWLVDWGFGISPWGLIVFLLLGFAAGVLNTLRAAGLAEQPRIDGKPPSGSPPAA